MTGRECRAGKWQAGHGRPGNAGQEITAGYMTGREMAGRKCRTDDLQFQAADTG